MEKDETEWKDVDLAVVAAIASSFMDKAIPPDMLILGEVGLTGEVRAIGQADMRAAEIRKMGFSRCLVRGCPGICFR